MEVREELVMRDGRVYERFGAPIYSEDDRERIGWVWTFRNITERKRLESNLVFLAETSLDLTSLNDIDEILEVMAQKIGKYLGAANCVFAAVDTIANTANIFHLWRKDNDAVDFAGKYELSEFISEEFRQTLMDGKPVVINDVLTDDRISEKGGRYAPLKIGSFINTPYVSDGVLRFVLGVYRQHPYAWRADEVELLSELMTRIWIRIERARAEQILREAEERYRALIEATTTTVWHATPDGALSFVGDHWTNVSGQSVDEILKWGWLEAIHPDDRERTIEVWQASLQNKSLYKTEFRVLTTKGKYEWFAVNAVPVFDAKGNVREWVGVNTNINEQIENEEALRKSEEKYRTLFNSIDVGFCVIEVLFDDGGQPFDYRFWEMNPAFEKQTGLSNAEGRTILELAPNFEKFWFETYGRIALTGESARFEHRAEALERWFEVYAFRIGQPQERKVAVLFNDISERKKTEEKIRESEENFRNLANSISQLAWMADAEGNIFWYNNRWFDYTGTNLEEMQGWGWQSVHHPEEVGRVASKFKEHIASGEIWEDTFPIRSKNGEYRWFLSRALPIYNESGEIVRWFGTNTDVEELRQARLQAEQANSLKDEFLATLSHELRTPLNAIFGWSQILQSRTLDEKGVKKALSTIERSARAQNQLIDDLLDVSRIITGKLRLDVRAADLPGIITAAADAVKPAAEAKGIRLQILLDPQAGPISGDPERLQQIVWNLLSNAVKFTPKGGRVEDSPGTGRFSY